MTSINNKYRITEEGKVDVRVAQGEGSLKQIIKDRIYVTEDYIILQVGRGHCDQRNKKYRRKHILFSN